MLFPQEVSTPKAQGEHIKLGLMQPTPLALLLHPFADILDGWTKGVPVNCGQPWLMEAVMVAVTWGAHLSTMTVEAIHLIHEDIDYQVQAGFACIVE